VLKYILLIVLCHGLFVLCLFGCTETCETGLVVKIGKCSIDSFFRASACRVELDTGVRGWTGGAVMVGDKVERCYYPNHTKKGIFRIQ